MKIYLVLKVLDIKTFFKKKHDFSASIKCTGSLSFCCMRDRSSGVVGPWPITHRLELETEKKFNGACCLGATLVFPDS